MVTINEFMALDIRVGKIVEVQDHEGTRKPMYKLKVDLGTEIGVRSLVAGIKPWYTKEELMNRLIVMVVNLEPKIIAGAPSEGMLLAADNGSADNLIVSILEPDKDMPIGSRIH